MKILLDMDGVIVDFVGAALRIHGAEDLYTRPSSLGCFDIEKLLGISTSAFWAGVDRDSGFWGSLQKTPEADAIVAAAVETVGWENIGVLTAPALADSCLIGKRSWLRVHYPRLVDRVTFARDKGWYASPNHLLIDDKNENVDGFRASGGIAILLPRPWNRNHKFAGDSVSCLKEELSDYGV